MRMNVRFLFVTLAVGMSFLDVLATSEGNCTVNDHLMLQTGTAAGRASKRMPADGQNTSEYPIGGDQTAESATKADNKDEWNDVQHVMHHLTDRAGPLMVAWATPRGAWAMTAGSPSGSNSSSSGQPLTTTTTTFTTTAGPFLAAVNSASCLLTAADGKFINIDYTAAKYTKYTFSLKMGNKNMNDGNTRNSDTIPHGGFKVCNLDGHSVSRGSSPELWYIDRNGDWGYATYNGGWGHVYKYTDKSYYGDAEPALFSEKTWEVVMHWTGSKYLLHSWTIEGVDFSKYKGLNSGCKSSIGTDGFTPRIWAYSSSIFGIRKFEVFQGNDVDNLEPLWKGPIALKAPPGASESKCHMTDWA